VFGRPTMARVFMGVSARRGRGSSRCTGRMMRSVKPTRTCRGAGARAPDDLYLFAHAQTMASIRAAARLGSNVENEAKSPGSSWSGSSCGMASGDRHIVASVPGEISDSAGAELDDGAPSYCRRATSARTEGDLGKP